MTEALHCYSNVEKFIASCQKVVFIVIFPLCEARVHWHHPCSTEILSPAVGDFNISALAVLEHFCEYKLQIEQFSATNSSSGKLRLASFNKIPSSLTKTFKFGRATSIQPLLESGFCTLCTDFTIKLWPSRVKKLTQANKNADWPLYIDRQQEKTLPIISWKSKWSLHCS